MRNTNRLQQLFRLTEEISVGWMPKIWSQIVIGFKDQSKPNTVESLVRYPLVTVLEGDTARVCLATTFILPLLTISGPTLVQVTALTHGLTVQYELVSSSLRKAILFGCQRNRINKPPSILGTTQSNSSQNEYLTQFEKLIRQENVNQEQREPQNLSGTDELCSLPHVWLSHTNANAKMGKRCVLCQEWQLGPHY